MSGYILPDIYFSTIETHLINLVENRSTYLGFYLKEYGFYDKTAEELTKHARTYVENLKLLNVLCVSFEYKNNYVGKLDKKIESYFKINYFEVPPRVITNIQFYTSLKQLNYNIGFHHVKGIREDLYHYNDFLQELIKYSAFMVVDSLDCDLFELFKIKRFSSFS